MKGTKALSYALVLGLVALSIVVAVRPGPRHPLVAGFEIGNARNEKGPLIS